MIFKKSLSMLSFKFELLRLKSHKIQFGLLEKNISHWRYFFNEKYLFKYSFNYSFSKTIIVCFLLKSITFYANN